MERFYYDRNEQEFIETSPIPLAIYQFLDKRVVTVALSRGFCDLLGMKSLEECYDLMNNDMYRDAHPDDRARIAELGYQFATKGGEYKAIYRTNCNGEWRIVSARGRHFYKENGVRLAAITYADEGPFVEGDEWVAGDFSASLSAYVHKSAMTHGVNYDYLTGLPSMTNFFELAAAGRDVMIANGEKPVMLFFDLCGMKTFNHRYGFAAGDELLQGLAAILRKYFTAESCSRFGSDHFAAFTSQDGLEDKLRLVLEESTQINQGNSLPLRIGIYESDDHLVEASTACDRAKMACDTNKNSFVSGYTYFNKDLLKAEDMRQYILSNFDRALSEDWIQVFYQPIVRLANGRVSDEEALARWEDPERGRILPQEFIPILEDARLIYRLDIYVASEVVKKMKNQAKAGFYVNPHSINLSRIDFYSCDIVDEITRIMDEAGISHDKLTLEVTESTVASDLNYLKSQVERFHELGFEVWLDDYGSGYSSPEILQQIPFNTIKFDMLFMRGFVDGNESRILLSELIRMAAALGMDTVVEGVETEEQLDFLREIGCSKAQGYYYCKPIPFEGILERNQKGIQIGFENPAETEYYAAVGRANLYNLSMTLENDEKVRRNYFDCTPIGILESNQEELWIVRSNPSFREFFQKNCTLFDVEQRQKIADLMTGANRAFVKALLACGKDGKIQMVDEHTETGQMVHLLIRRLALNPVTRVTAFAIVLLGISENRDGSDLSFTTVAQALSTDYIYFYQVDMDKECFVEYGLGDTSDHLYIERRGENFFRQSHVDAKAALHEDDYEPFVQAFTKENVANVIRESGSFTFTYRLMQNGEPMYVHMKAVRISDSDNMIIIGVSNIDAQKKQQEAFERVKQERIIYSRVAALSDDYLFIYTVDPNTGEYSKFTEKKENTGEDIGEHGDDFFDTFRNTEEKKVYPEDLKMFRNSFTRDRIFKAIKKKGIFSLNYRVMMGEEPVYVCLRAALTRENDVQQLIVGISNIDEQVKRDLEYVNNLTEARNEVNLDALTGVKSRHAYIDVEDQMNSQIEDNNCKEFAVAIFDINDLKKVNDTYGHKAGDEYIKKGCAIICEIFRHCPVFRVGGDEFVVIVQGKNYANLDKLMELVQKKNAENLQTGDVVLAAGMARYENDKSVAAVFERADVQMYENKSKLKEQSI